MFEQIYPRETFENVSIPNRYQNETLFIEFKYIYKLPKWVMTNINKCKTIAYRNCFQ